MYSVASSDSSLSDLSLLEESEALALEDLDAELAALLSEDLLEEASLTAFLAAASSSAFLAAASFSAFSLAAASSAAFFSAFSASAFSLASSAFFSSAFFSAEESACSVAESDSA